MITEFQVWNQYVAGGNRFQRLPLINQRFLHKLEKLLLNKPHSLLSRSMICLNKNLTAKELIPHSLWNLEPITHHIVSDIVKIILTVNEPITSVGMCWVLSKTLLWNYLRQLGIHNGEKHLLKTLLIVKITHYKKKISGRNHMWECVRYENENKWLQ